MSGSEALLYAYLAGTGLQMVGDQQADNERKRIINRSMAEAEDTQGKAIDTVQQEAAQMAPQQRLQAMLAAEQGNVDRGMGDIVGAGGASIAAPLGNVSQDFLRGKAERTATEGDRLTSVVRELARTRAPGDVATKESMRRSAISEQLGSLWNSQRNRSNAATMDAQDVEAPGYGQIGGLVALASGAAMGAGAGASASGGSLATGATNPALIESAVGTAGYGASSAGAAGANPWWVGMSNGMRQRQQQQPFSAWQGRR